MEWKLWKNIEAIVEISFIFNDIFWLEFTEMKDNVGYLK